MLSIRRVVFWAMIPANLLAVAWVWLGRTPFGVGGWYLILFAFTVVPVMAGCLTLTTALAHGQRIPAERGHLSGAQAFAQVALWVAIGGFGFFVVEVTDVTTDARSIFTVFAGDDYRDTSNRIAVGFMFASLVLYALLLVLLLIGYSKRPKAPTLPPPAGGSPQFPGGPPRFPAGPPQHPAAPPQYPGTPPYRRDT